MYGICFVEPSVVQLVINLPAAVISCLAAVLNYLEDFGLQKALQDTRYHMYEKIRKKYANLCQKFDLRQFISDHFTLNKMCL